MNRKGRLLPKAISGEALGIFRAEVLGRMTLLTVGPSLFKHRKILLTERGWPREQKP